MNNAKVDIERRTLRRIGGNETHPHSVAMVLQLGLTSDPPHFLLFL